VKNNLRTLLLAGTAFLAVSTYGITQAAAACAGGTVGLLTPPGTTTPAGVSGAAGIGSGCPGGDGVDYGANTTSITGSGAWAGGAGATGTTTVGGFGGIGSSFGTFTGNTLANTNGVTGGAGGAGAALSFGGGAGGAGIFDNTINNTITVGAGASGAVGGAGGAGFGNGAGIGGAGGIGGIGLDITVGGTGAHLTAGAMTGGAGGAGGTSVFVGSAAATTGAAGGAGIVDLAGTNIVAGGAFTGGAGGAGGANSGNGVGGAGAVGGDAADIGGTTVTFSAAGVVTGGLGGAGGAGGTNAGQANSAGANGGAGISDTSTTSSISTAVAVVGGQGGAGGASTGALGFGGAAGVGGVGVSIGGTTTSYTAAGNITGGAGGAGGASTGAGQGINGGIGGAALSVTGTGDTVTLNGGMTLLGGAGGAAGGVSGAGVAGLPGAAGDGIDLGGTGTILVNHDTINGQTAMGIDITNLNALASFTNSGNVTSANVTAGQGTVVFGADNGNVTLGAGGTITNTAGVNAVTLQITAAQTGVITNAGTIVSDGGAGVAVNFGANASLTNTGTITGRITETGNPNVTLINTGTITGNIALPGTGADTLTLAGGTFTGTVTLGTGTNVVNVVNSATTPTIIGTVATTNISAGQILTVPTYVAVAGTTLQTNLTSTGTVNTIGSLTSTGSTVNLAGETVNVVTPVGPIAVGANHAVILARGNAPEVAADDPTLVTDNSSFYNFTVTPGTGGQADDLLLTATLANSTDAAVNGALATFAAEGVNATPGEVTLNGINAIIAAAPTAAAAHNDMQSLTPTVDGGAQGVAFNAVQETQDIADTRMAALRTGDTTSGVAAGASSHGAGMWFEGYGQHSSQDMLGNTNGYRANTWGGAVGFDSSALMNKSIVGFALNYGHSIVNSSNANTTATDVGNYGLNVYGTYDLGQKMFASAQAGYAYNTVDSDRHNADLVGGTAHGSTTSDQYSAKVGLGRDYPVDGGMTLTPTATAGYTYLSTAGYTETGAAVGSNLVVGSNSQNALDLGVGLKAGWKLKAGDDGSVIKPALHVGYAYAAIDDKVQTSASFSGDPAATTFTTTGASPGRNIFDVGANVVFATAANWDFSANYDLQLKQAYSSNTGELRATAHF